MSENTQKVNSQNERIKHKYYEYLQESQGFSESTITAIKKAIYRYEEFTDFEDFSKFNKKKAIEFKKWLEIKKDTRTNKQISLSTVYHYIRNLKDFFKWLKDQKGYKNICSTDIDYLKLDKQKTRIAIAAKREKFPTFEQIKKVIDSIEINSEIDLRDRALISFTFLSAMRDSAIISLPICCFNDENLIVSQDPKLGVNTKSKKTIYTKLFNFDESMLEYFLDWYKYLKTDKLFGNSDPVFPKNMVENAEGTKTFISNSVEPKFWQSVTSLREIFKTRFQHAGIEYYPPHSFRHAAILNAVKKAKDPEELKAISQNVGHENIGTTLMTYGTLTQHRVEELIENIDFSILKNNDSKVDKKHILEQLSKLLDD